MNPRDKADCVSCQKNEELIYRGMCGGCTRDFRYTRYRGWIERKAMRTGSRIPGEGPRRFIKAKLKVVNS